MTACRERTTVLSARRQLARPDSEGPEAHPWPSRWPRWGDGVFAGALKRGLHYSFPLPDQAVSTCFPCVMTTPKKEVPLERWATETVRVGGGEA